MMEQTERETLSSIPGDVESRMPRSLRPVQKRTLTQETFDQLFSYIQDGGLQPGDALPSQYELARQLSVSRPVLREAMQRLAAAGMVEVRHGSGSYVAHPPIETMFTSIFGKYTYEKAIEVLDVRMLLEVEMAGRAATMADENDHQRLKHALETIRNLSAAGDLTVSGADEFHRALADAAHNSVIAAIAQLLHLPNYIQGIRVELALPDISAHEYESHLKLYKAICTGDQEVARAAAREHLSFSHNSTQQAAGLRHQFEELSE